MKWPFQITRAVPLAGPAGPAVAAPLAGFAIRPHFSRWQYAVFLIALLVLVPLGVVLSSLFSLEGEIWRHLIETTLLDLIFNTLWLVAGVGATTALLGISLAWLTVSYDFPGRRFLDLALLLPLSIPPYVLAFVMIRLLDYAGPLQTGLRLWIGTERMVFPPIRSRGGVILVMSLSLYPYVYAITRNAFLTQGRPMMEVAQSLGHSRLNSFFKIALPIARPSIVGGVMLALMEAVSDFGTVSIFNYDTFTTAIYKTWFGFFSLEAAAQLASVFILIVFVAILLVERAHPSIERSCGPGASSNIRIRLTGLWALMASAYPILVLLMAFMIPVTQLFVWALRGFFADFDDRFVSFLWHSLLLGGMAAFMTVFCALFLAYAKRLKSDGITRMMVRLSTLGYAMPGSVLAVGIFIPLVWIDHQMIAWGRWAFGVSPGFLLRGTWMAMLIGFLIRFMAVAYRSVDTEMQRITSSMDEVSRGMGLAPKQRLLRIYLPMLKPGLLTGAILVFVDVMKEMPITLMTRPFGWDTLSVRIFEMTSEGEWERAALPSLVLILAGFVPVFLLARLQRER